MRYDDRFDATTYADDPPVHIFLVEAQAGDEVWIAERLWHRLQGIASAYQLHILPMLGWSSDAVFLNAQQCDNLADELRLASAVTNDDLLAGLAASIVRMCERSRGASKNVLGIEFSSPVIAPTRWARPTPSTPTDRR